MTPPEALSEWSTLSDDALVECFAGVTVWRANGKRAPHKPLLMFEPASLTRILVGHAGWAFARLQRRQPRRVTFAEIEERAGGRSESHEMPVWRPALLAARRAPPRCAL
jgi:hypothetical protein